MFMQTMDYAVQTQGTLTSTAITAEMNSMLFESAINKTYSDKIKAPIRELCTNARDGHAKNGNIDQPFDVHLPTHYDQQFYVRDYGCSMTEQQVKDTYSVLFASTKRGSNLEVGQIGIGSKSPFALVTGFAVTCWKDGEERIYSMYRDETGMPRIAMLSKGPSDEPQGMKVSFPIRYQDVSQFRRSAQAVFFGFPNKPNVVNETFEFSAPREITKGENWTIYDGTDFPLTNGVYARQGCVLYPISTEFLGRNYPAFNRYINVVIDFPIGSLSFATSRETLGYDDVTVTNLKTALDNMVNEINTVISEELDAAPNYWEAIPMYQRFFSGNYDSAGAALLALTGGAAFYKGLPIKTEFKLNIGSNAKNSVVGMYFEHDDYRIRPKGFVNLTFRQKTQEHAVVPSTMQFTKVVVELPKLNKSTARMRTFLQQVPEGYGVIWLRVPIMMMAEAWAKQHGGVELVNLSDFKPAAPQSKTLTTEVKVRLRYVVASKAYSRWNRKPDTATYEDVVICAKDDLPYVEQADGGVCTNRNMSAISLNTLADSLRSAVQAGVIHEGARIYLVNRVVAKRVESVLGKNFPLWDDFLKKRVKFVFDTDNLRIASQSYDFQKNRSLATKLVESGGPLFGTLRTFVDTYNVSVPVNDRKLTSPEQDMVNRYFPEVFVKTDDTQTVRDREALEEEFPLLDRISSGYNSDNKLIQYYLTLVESSLKGSKA